MEKDIQRDEIKIKDAEKRTPHYYFSLPRSQQDKKQIPTAAYPVSETRPDL